MITAEGSIDPSFAARPCGVVVAAWYTIETICITVRLLWKSCRRVTSAPADATDVVVASNGGFLLRKAVLVVWSNMTGALAHGGIPVPLDGDVCTARHKLCNVGPSVSQTVPRFENYFLLLAGPRVPLEGRVKVVYPPGVSSERRRGGGLRFRFSLAYGSTEALVLRCIETFVGRRTWPPFMESKC